MLEPASYFLQRSEIRLVVEINVLSIKECMLGTS